MCRPSDVGDLVVEAPRFDVVWAEAELDLPSSISSSINVSAAEDGGIDVAEAERVEVRDAKRCD